MDNGIKIEYKKIFLILLVTILLLLGISYLFYINLNKDTSKTVEAVVKYSGDDYVIVTDENNDEYMLELDGEYNVGDKLSLKLDDINDKKDPIEAEVKDIKVISRVVEFTIEDKGNNPKENATSNSTSNNDLSNSNENDTSSIDSSNNDTVGSEADVINYFKSLDSSLDNSKNSSSISSSIKTGFVTVVDFLFYGGQIKGKTFNELSTSAKLNVLKLALSIDKKIDSYFPGYKDSLTDKYKNIKSKVVSTYLDITCDICAKNEDTCSAAKEGLTDLKQNFNITWTFIKDISGVGISKLKSWYEVWKNA